MNMVPDVINQTYFFIMSVTVVKAACPCIL